MPTPDETARHLAAMSGGDVDGCAWALDFGDRRLTRRLANLNPAGLRDAAIQEPRLAPELFRACPELATDASVREPVLAAGLRRNDPNLLLELARVPGADVPAFQRAYLACFEASKDLRRRLYQSAEFLQKVPDANPALHLELFKKLQDEDTILWFILNLHPARFDGKSPSKPVPYLSGTSLQDALNWVFEHGKDPVQTLSKVAKAEHVTAPMLEEAAFKGLVPELPPLEEREYVQSPTWQTMQAFAGRVAFESRFEKALRFATSFKLLLSPDGLEVIDRAASLLPPTSSARRKFIVLFPEASAADETTVVDIMER